MRRSVAAVIPPAAALPLATRQFPHVFGYLHPAAGSAWLSGAGIGIGLFAIVGAQSAFILRQGIMRQHVVPIIATCFAIDASFIFASVAGLRTLTDQLPWLTTVLLWGGVAFLAWYALQSARRALSGGGGMQLDDDAEQSLRTALMAAAGFSIINPHFWLDMMVIGSIADNFGNNRMAFAAGVVTASAAWLTMQGLGARLLAPLFTKPSTWRVLDRHDRG
ncbi:LysE/ArgO family amino acid transporter, partial [Stenotrophomonas pictorum]|uniref:LysE/ArgO family amino acid transporter n=1 Tax=Stenotrophomonas pictorum TaxID=86184 RepID=UPI00210A6DA0